MEDQPRREVRFEKLARPAIERFAERATVLLFPFGAIEQHGPHLPVETDTFNAQRFCLDAATALEDVLVAPAVPWGLSHAHVGCGATLSLRPSTCLELAMDLTESAIRAGFTRIIWVNGHHGNKPILGLIVYEAKRVHGLSVGAVTYYDLAAEAFGSARATPPGGSGHACEFETSLMLHLQPDAVGDYAAVKRPIEPRTDGDMRDLLHPGTTAIGYTFEERFPEGVMGDPTLASAATGSRLYEAARDQLVTFIEQFRALPPEGIRTRSNQAGVRA